jgi:hypothetical protein
VSVVCHSGALISAEAVPHVEAREAPELTDPDFNERSDT